MQPPAAAELAQALDFALALGLIKESPQGLPAPAPFAWRPCPLDAASHQALQALTAPCNLLAWRVASSLEFLHEALAGAAQVDEFTAWLLDLASQPASAPAKQPLELLISRSDYFLQSTGAAGPPLPRQVELNTIAASYAGLAGRVQRLHGALWGREPGAARLVANEPVRGIAQALAQGVARQGQPGACLLMVVQPGESNRVDQRLVELALLEHDVPTRRMTLEEVAQHGSLRQGHLLLGSQPCAVAYLRAGYAPDDLRTPAARQGRTLIEHSDALCVPTARLQLAGTKKVQQLLAQPRTLRQFLPEAQASLLERCFAAQYALDDPLEQEGQARPAWEHARRRPQDWVLKPQREGGGNNLYDADLARALVSLSHAQRAAYVLMERIRPQIHEGLLVRDGQVTPAMCVSEIGRFGVFLAQGPRVLLNQDVGYLVRTRSDQVREGGVSAGFGHLDSLLLTD